MTPLLFANITKVYPANTLKLTVEVTSWGFKSISNKLIINFDTTPLQQQQQQQQQINNNNKENNCIDSDHDGGGSLRWVAIQVGESTLYLLFYYFILILILLFLLLFYYFYLFLLFFLIFILLFIFIYIIIIIIIVIVLFFYFLTYLNVWRVFRLGSSGWTNSTYFVSIK
jgi:type IV secretory pathway VirB6-like protein